ncbi:MAG: nitrile hydratase accessory protein [Alphaproteobacteria bacterium]
MEQPPTPPGVFEAPWHGQVFALAVILNRAGHFTWPEWTEVFSNTLADMGKTKELDGSDDYYVAWVTALEEMLVTKGIVIPDALSDMKTLWTDAFLSTPHGKPVHPAKLVDKP